MGKELVGSKIRYRYWGTPKETPMERVGTIKVWGKKYITTTRETTGKDDYCDFDGFEMADGSATPVTASQPPTEDLEPAPVSFHNPNPSKEPPSVFSFLQPGSFVEYREALESGVYYGYFVKYEKHYKQVTVETIPPFRGAPRRISVREALCSPYGANNFEHVCLGRCGTLVPHYEGGRCRRCGGATVHLGLTAKEQLLAEPGIILRLRTESVDAHSVYINHRAESAQATVPTIH